jgi:T5SS/PEP-CTERM-associated repeat protein
MSVQKESIMKKRLYCLVSMLALFVSFHQAAAQVTFGGSAYNTGPGGYVDVIGGTTAFLNPTVLYLNGSLTISNGAVWNDGGCNIGGYGGDLSDPGAGSYIATGNVIVDGTNSLLDDEIWGHSNGSTNMVLYQNGLSVGGGWLGADGSLTIQNGGAVHSYGFGNVGAPLYQTGSSGTAIVNGIGSTWTISPSPYSYGEINVGPFEAAAQSDYGRLIITNGGVVYLAGAGCSVYSSQYASSSIIVDGFGSSLIASNASFNADYDYGASNLQAQTLITIRNGGYIGDQHASLSMATMVVDGIRSVWTNGESISMGNDGSPITPTSLTIQNGGSVYAGGGVSIVDGCQLIVAGPGSLLTCQLGFGILDVEGGSASLLVSNGGSIQITGTNGYNGAGEFALGSGNTGIVAGSNSSITCGLSLGISGVLTLEGGVLTCSASPGISVGYDGTGWGTLKGYGTANGNFQVSGGTLAPSDGAGGIGTLAVNGNLNWGNGNSPIYDFSIGSSNDEIIVSSNLELSGTLNITTLPGVAAGSCTLFT